MIMLTWTSMNIDAYKAHIHAGLRKLEELVVNINDIIENRIEKNLKMVRYLIFFVCFLLRRTSDLVLDAPYIFTNCLLI